jgi:hypothetical protein
MTHVCYFRHALALDERRVKFLPEYAYGGQAKPRAKSENKNTSLVDHEPPTKDNDPSTGNEDVDDRSQLGNSKKLGSHPHTMEVWFAGTHSDM